ncbi:MAG: hypothetical protein N2112_15350 [Gemmataceae bacterium]|nr:hypothetical protein [Gemmataceae bacterium]
MNFKEFDRDEIRFQYPADWEIEIEEEEDQMGWTVSVASPDSAFLVIAYRVDEEPSRLVEAALESLREDFQDLDAQPTMETLNKQPAFGYNIEFITLDLTNTAWLRGVDGPEGGILIMGQMTDQDRPMYEQPLRDILDSLSWEE